MPTARLLASSPATQGKYQTHLGKVGGAFFDSISGETLRWILFGSPDLGKGQEVELPCPARDLIELAIAKNDALMIDRRLRQNPTLLLLALQQFKHANGRPPQSASKLVHWCAENFDALLIAMDSGLIDSPNRNFASRETGKLIDGFCRSRTNRELRNSLRRFLVAFGMPGKKIKRLVRQWLGEQIHDRQFRSKSPRKRNRRSQIVASWLDEGESEFEIKPLLHQLIQACQTEANFEARLLVEKLASMKQLAYGASHEINNPLANVATRAQTLLTIEPDPEKRHKLAVIYEQAMRAHEMISDMMLFAHPPAIRRCRVSLRLLLHKILNEIGPSLETSQGVNLEVTIGAGVDVASLDPTQFAVLVKCLIQNSIEAITSAERHGGKIEVRLDQGVYGEIRLAVWDDGIGIANDVAPHVFDPFYSGREAGRGLGFGLCKVWTIAHMHEGTVTLDREVTSGTQFTVRIPKEPCESELKRSKSDAKALAAISIGQRPTIHQDEAA